MRNSLFLALAPLLTAVPALAQSYAPGAKPAVDDEPAYVEAPAPSRGGYGPRSNDHTGVLVRLSVGVGGGGVNEDWGTSELKLSGGAMMHSIAIGGSVAPNLALGVDFFGFNLREPKAQWAGQSYDTKNFGIAVGGIGFNATNYFAPSNVYLSGTIGLVQVVRSRWSSSGTAQSVTSENDSRGLGLSLMVGKEWMVSREWGLGVAGQFVSASTTKSESGKDVDAASVALGVNFTATYF
jgi:hypothetical protein